MCEEHGYQRSGKKCREKFENLYKYYKKTKGGKVGRQDGKHYRFFRQLEALYGKTSNNPSSETLLVENSIQFHSGTNNSTQLCNQESAYQAPKLSAESLSLCSSSSDFDSSSSDDHNDIANASMLMDIDSTGKMMMKKKRRGRRSWKAKIRDFIDEKMRKILEKQEAWLVKIMETLEQKEQERVLRDEEWRKQEAARIDRENKFWANERAWIEARDAALMEALQKIMGKEVKVSSPECEVVTLKGTESWAECEVTRLIQLRSSMESRFEQCGCGEEVVILWEEIAAKMGCLGYERNGLMCKDKWNRINNYLCKTKESNKKRKENSRSCFNFENNESIDGHHNQGGGGYCQEIIKDQQAGSELTRVLAAVNAGGLSPNSSGTINGMHMHDSCFRFLMGDGGGGGNLWENYGVKLSKGES